MFQIRKSNERGHARHSWLDSKHTFSFANYYDPQFMGFRDLRVINEDIVDPAKGFGTHPHNDMEIITYVLSGTLEHKDSMGNGSLIVPGEVQVMSAGTGVTHSEYNHSPNEPVHLLQIWVLPDKLELKPTYQQKGFHDARRDALCLVVSKKGSHGSLVMHQDAFLFASLLSAGKKLEYSLDLARYAWIQIATGKLQINDQFLGTGDGLAVSKEKNLTFQAIEETEFLLFDLA